MGDGDEKRGRATRKERRTCTKYSVLAHGTVKMSFALVFFVVRFFSFLPPNNFSLFGYVSVFPPIPSSTRSLLQFTRDMPSHSGTSRQRQSRPSVLTLLILTASFLVTLHRGQILVDAFDPSADSNLVNYWGQK